MIWFLLYNIMTTYRLNIRISSRNFSLTEVVNRILRWGETLKLRETNYPVDVGHLIHRLNLMPKGNTA